MGMRTDCRNYESRTYASGETVRMCRKDLAPEAPWRCPENCPGFEFKSNDGGWTTGSLSYKPSDEEPPVLDDNAIAMLDSAEDIINAIGPEALREAKDRRAAQEDKPKRKWWPFGKGR
jgi:hypothetical protein